MKKFLVIFFIAFTFFYESVDVCAFDVSAKSAIVIDGVTKEVLYEKNAYEKRGMASTTKIMTALIAIENLQLDEIVKVSSFAASTEGSSMWLSAGEMITVEDLLYGLMLSSGNDAATALAEHTSGSISSFTLLMNEKAKKLGAVDTNFTNPHGLPDNNHYTTAYDLAVISAAAMDNLQFESIVRTENKTVSWEGHEWDRYLTNHNKLLKKSGNCIGIKTGFTKKDGRCLVSCFEKENQRFIIVTLSAPDDWNDHLNLASHCFSNFSPAVVSEKGEKAGILRKKNQLADDIELIYKDSCIISSKENNTENIKRDFEFFAKFPVKKGDVVGKCSIYLNDIVIKQIDLVAGNDSFIKVSFTNTIKQLMKGIIKA